MSWDSFVIGGKQRPIKISRMLDSAVYRFVRDTKRSRSSLFDIAIIKLWRTWNGGTNKNEPKDEQSLDKICNILTNNPMPGNLSKNEPCYLYGSFRGEGTYNFAHEILKNYGADSINDLIRRSVTFLLKEQGYLDLQNEDEVEGLP